MLSRLVVCIADLLRFCSCLDYYAGFFRVFFCAYILVWSTIIVLSSLEFLLLVLTCLAPLVCDPKVIATFLIFPLSEQFPVDFGAACH